MASSQDLLHVDPTKELNVLLLKKDLESRNAKPNIQRPEKPQVLSQVKDFLPLLASANEKLEKDLAFKPLSDFDIENVESDETFVEMNIGLYLKGNQSSSDESSDSDEEQICKMFSEVTEDNIQLQKVSKIKPNLISEVRADVNKNVKPKVKGRSIQTKTCKGSQGRKKKK